MMPLAQYSLLEDSESVLLPTDTGTQEGTSNRATEAPTAEHDDDNSLGYTADSSRKTERTLAVFLSEGQVFKIRGRERWNVRSLGGLNVGVCGKENEILGAKGDSSHAGERKRNSLFTR
ncbi:unnamed protein product [Leuciscus chuanchicus]